VQIGSALSSWFILSTPIGLATAQASRRTPVTCQEIIRFVCYDQTVSSPVSRSLRPGRGQRTCRHPETIESLNSQRRDVSPRHFEMILLWVDQICDPTGPTVGLRRLVSGVGNFRGGCTTSRHAENGFRGVEGGRNWAPNGRESISGQSPCDVFRARNPMVRSEGLSYSLERRRHSRYWISPRT
jgi:hypothetical protein